MTQQQTAGDFDIPAPRTPTAEEARRSKESRMTDDEAFRMTKMPTIDTELPAEFQYRGNR